MTKKTTLSRPPCAPVAPAGLGSPYWAYEGDCWGERGSDELGFARSDRLHGTAFARQGDFEGDPLTYAFVGRQSRLVWWTGTTGSLKRSMPVLSESQVEATDGDVPLRDLLSNLWLAWREESPSRAASLVRWVEKAILVTEALRRDMTEQDLDFIAFEADDYLEDVPGHVFKQSVSYREHHPDAVVAWFRSQCGEFRAAESGYLDDRPAVPEEEVGPRDFSKWREPKWFRDKDPILSLPPKDRAVCLDLLEAITGGVVHDNTPRLGLGHKKASYKQVSQFVGLAREYEKLLSEYDEERVAWHFADKEELESNKAMRDAVLASIDAMLFTFGHPDVPAAPLATKSERELLEIPGRYASHSPYRRIVQTRRVATAKALSSKRKEESTKYRRQSFDAFIAGVLREALGAEALEDVVVRAILATDSRSTMRHYASLFRVDRAAQTIRHGDEFKRMMALATGTHSECVARRIGRHIWELYRSGARAASREDELERVVATMLSYRIPCSAEQEQELLALVPFSQVKRFKAEWDGAERKYHKHYSGEGSVSDVQQHVVEETSVRMSAEEMEGVQAFPFLRKLSVVRQEVATPNAATRQCVVNPIHLLFHGARMRRVR